MEKFGWKCSNHHECVCVCMPGKWKNPAGNVKIINAHAHAYPENEKPRPEMFKSLMCITHGCLESGKDWPEMLK